MIHSTTNGKKSTELQWIYFENDGGHRIATIAIFVVGGKDDIENENMLDSIENTFTISNQWKEIIYENTSDETKQNEQSSEQRTICQGGLNINPIKEEEGRGIQGVWFEILSDKRYAAWKNRNLTVPHYVSRP